MFKESISVNGSGKYLRMAGKHTNPFQVGFHELKVRKDSMDLFFPLVTTSGLGQTCLDGSFRFNQLCGLGGQVRKGMGVNMLKVYARE